MDLDPNGTMQTVPVMISKDLYKNVENRIKLSNGLFKTVEEYVSFILTEVVKEELGSVTENGFTREEDEEIKSRLKNLGYI